ERGVAESLFDLGDLLDVIGPGALAQTEKVLTRLVALQQRQQAPFGRGHLGRDGGVVAGDKLGRAMFANNVVRRPAASRCHVDLARIGFGIGDELWEGLGRHRWINLHDEAEGGESADRRDVADEIEVASFVSSVALAEEYVEWHRHSEASPV